MTTTDFLHFHETELAEFIQCWTREVKFTNGSLGAELLRKHTNYLQIVNDHGPFKDDLRLSAQAELENAVTNASVADLQENERFLLPLAGKDGARTEFEAAYDGAATVAGIKGYRRAECAADTAPLRRALQLGAKITSGSCSPIESTKLEVFFDNNDSLIQTAHKLLEKGTADATQDLRNWLGGLECLRRRKICVQGHTDDVGDGPHNKALGDSRAKGVKEFLQALDHDLKILPMDSVPHESKGPIPPSDDERAKNRKVVLFVEAN